MSLSRGRYFFCYSKESTDFFLCQTQFREKSLDMIGNTPFTIRVLYERHEREKCNEHSKKCLAPSARRRRILTEGRLHAEKTRKLARGRVPDGREISPGGPEMLLKEEISYEKVSGPCHGNGTGCEHNGVCREPLLRCPCRPLSLCRCGQAGCGRCRRWIS